MGFLRSLFIPAFIAYLLAAVCYALLQMLRGTEPLVGWLGVALAASGPLAFFAWIMASKPARTARHPVGYSMLGGLGLAIALAISWRHGQAAGLVHAWAGVAVIGWLVYLRWYSPLPRRNGERPTLGDPLPEFGLEDTGGGLVQAGDFRGRPHVLVFYRGNWCPFCTAQVREVARNYRELRDAGAAVIMISPQPPDEHRKLAKRYDIPIRFLRDPGNAAARTLGIEDRWGLPLGLQLFGYPSDTVLPTVVITDGLGIIRYTHRTDNYRIRPEPAEFLPVIRSLRA